MNLIQIALFVSLFQFGFGKSLWDDEDSSYQKPILRISHINVYGESRYMKVFTFIHEDRAHFDLKVLLKQELGSNFLIFNLKVRVRPQGGASFVTLLQMKRLDLCGFLSDFSGNSMMRYFLKSNMQMSEIISCPVRVGNFSLANVSAYDIYPANLQNGTYKFFVEVVEGTGEIAKVFALQVTTDISVPACRVAQE
ncbi:uncharacterized protein LOC117899173 [Drosophila subobscura]|uniref:uncharacterized protein LOC117899173 n=1 Tax=Drosophila subobscura TaxID=7241 RepID=UPI00155ADD81|nr:uncharacterized protein LOC117899173 [Drosophila subobscura]